MQAHLALLTQTARYDQALELFISRFERELEEIQGVGPSSDRGQQVMAAAVRLVEELVGRLQLDLNSERSQLLAELSSSKARVESLERQLDDALRLLLDAQRSRKPGLIRSGLLALAGFLAGVGTGAAEGVGGAVAEQFLEGDTAPVSVEYSIACFALDEVLDRSGVYAAGRGDQSGGQDSEGSEPATKDEEELDDVDGDPWLVAPPELGPEYVVWKEAGFHPSDAMDWSDFGFGVEDALRWLAYGFSPSESRAWIDRSSDSSTPHHIEPSAAANFSEYEFSPDEAMAWMDYGFEAEEASSWDHYEFDPSEAAEWNEEGIGAEDADDWRSQQLTPHDARLELGDSP